MTSPRAEFIKRYLAWEMSRHRGRKHLRKKKALRVLARKWLARTLAIPISRRLNYAEIGRQLLAVQPLPPLPAFMLTIEDDKGEP